LLAPSEQRIGKPRGAFWILLYWIVNIINMVKRLAKKKLPMLSGAIKTLFIYFPALLIYYAAFHYTIGIAYSDGQYYILFLAIGLTATMSGLAFRASSVVKDNKQKTDYLYSGERLFHGALLYAVALVLKYANSPDNYLQIRWLNYPIIKFIAVALEAVYFFYGTIFVTNAILMLHRILFEKQYKPLSELEKEEINRLVQERKKEVAKKESVPASRSEVKK
jgi:uncharacterized membrane protein